MQAVRRRAVRCRRSLTAWRSAAAIGPLRRVCAPPMVQQISNTCLVQPGRRHQHSVRRVSRDGTAVPHLSSLLHREPAHQPVPEHESELYLQPPRLSRCLAAFVPPCSAFTAELACDSMPGTCKFDPYANSCVAACAASNCLIALSHSRVMQHRRCRAPTTRRMRSAAMPTRPASTLAERVHSARRHLALPSRRARC